MKQINFSITKEETEQINAICNRALKMFPNLSDKMSLTMDITATHKNGTPLDLPKLMSFDGGNFAHDIFGIMKHINRRTGELEDCFLPRCSKHD